MLTTKPYLYTRRPSPTTAEFIVTTQPPLTTTLRLVLAGVNILRVITSLSALLVLNSVWTLSPYFPSHALSSSSNPYDNNTNGLATPPTTTTTTTAIPSILSSSSPILNDPMASGGGGDGRHHFLVLSDLLNILSYIQHSTLPGRLALQLASSFYYSNGQQQQQQEEGSPASYSSSSLTTSIPFQQQQAGAAAGGGGFPPSATLLCIICVLLLCLSARRLHTEERLLVLRGLGIQTSTSSPWVVPSLPSLGLGLFDFFRGFISSISSLFFPSSSSSSGDGKVGGGGGGSCFEAGSAGAGAGAQTRFIPTTRIQDCFVNEAFRGFEVRHYLAVVVEGEEEVVVVFPRLLPGNKVVERVWRGLKSCLYEDHHYYNGGVIGGGGGTGGGGMENAGSGNKRLSVGG